MLKTVRTWFRRRETDLKASSLHGELLHGLRDKLRKTLGRGSAACAESFSLAHKGGFGLRCRAPKAFCVKSGLNLRDLGVHLVVKIFQFFRTDVELPRGVLVGGKTAVESGKPFFIEVVSVEILSERARRVIHDAGGVTQLLRGILKL